MLLENNELIIDSKISGGELTRIYSKKYNKEILWNGDKKHWGRHSPILFPIVGKLQNDQTIIEKKSYKMTQHGFARDFDFTLENKNENSITYSLKSSDETKKFYPYDFKLSLSYTLIDNKIEVNWKVENIDNKEIQFAIGAHPAFNITDINDCYLEFESKKQVSQIIMKPPYHDNKIDINIDKLDLTPKTFEGDALIYTNVDSINVKNKNEEDYLKISFDNFPLVGVWTSFYKEENSTAPFLCIEPWYGICDNINSNGNYKDKEFINTLNIKETFNVSYFIEII